MNIPQYPVADNRYMTVEEVDEKKHSCCEENKQLIDELTERVDHIEVGEYDDTELRTAISSLTNTVTNQQVIIGDLVYGDADNENKISALTETLNNDYYTKDEVTELDNAVASQIVDVRSELLQKIAEAEIGGEVSLDNYYTKDEIDDELQDYVTDFEFSSVLSEKLDSTAYTPYNDAELRNEIDDLELNKADKSDIVSVESEITLLQTAVTASSNAVGVLSTALENKADKSEITETITTIINAIFTYDPNTNTLNITTL